MTDHRPLIYEVLDDRFRPCANGDQQLETLYVGSRWAEGPVYVPAWRQLIWSDIPNDRLLRWDEPTGVGRRLPEPGRLRQRQHPRPVTAGWSAASRATGGSPGPSTTGSVTVIADRFDGRRLNSPNDATVKSDGSIWFSDPDFGIRSDYEGHRADSEIGACNVYRVDPGDGSVRLVAEGSPGPTAWSSPPTRAGCWSPTAAANQIVSFAVHDDGDARLAERSSRSARRATSTTCGWTTRAGSGSAPCEDGVHCYAPDGTLIGKIKTPEIVANICFGGPEAQPDVPRRQHHALLAHDVRNGGPGHRAEGRLTP